MISTDHEKAAARQAPGQGQKETNRRESSIHSGAHQAELRAEIPSSETAEKWVLSELMKDGALLEKHPLDPEVFHYPAHRVIYRRMVATGATDAVILAQAMQAHSETDFIPTMGAIVGYSFGPHLERQLAEINDCHLRRQACEHGRKLIEDASDRSDAARYLATAAKVGDIVKAGSSESAGNVVRGFLTFPTSPPPEDVLAGDGWLRIGDLAFFNSSAGAGKSVAFAQLSIAWGLGLPYLGIKPSRPLRILHYVGEDDESTMGQCREGLLEHALELFGRDITPAMLATLDGNVRTDFSRQATGKAFLAKLDADLAVEPVDLVMINPLLSFIGGEIVANASEFLRDGLMPLMQKHRTACLIAHHTVKLSKTGWDDIDPTYSGTGGGEPANAPRAILTLMPTKAKGLHVVIASKRQTTGWVDDDQKFTDRQFFRRSDSPIRPAWIPVSKEKAESMIEDGTPAKGRQKKVGPGDVVAMVKTGAMMQKVIILDLIRSKGCGNSMAKDAVREAKDLKIVATFEEKNPRGGKAIVWVCLPEHLDQWLK